MRLRALCLLGSFALALAGVLPAAAIAPQPPTLQQSALDMDPQGRSETPAAAPLSTPAATAPAPSAGATSATAASTPEPERLPATASPYQDLATLGLLTLGGALLLGRLRRGRE
jgi:hypothetical protein